MTGVAVVIPNRNGAGVLERCLDALERAEGVAEIVVVDDGSTDGSDAGAASRGARVLRPPGRGFAAAVNHGVAKTDSALVLLLNSDAFVRPRTIELLADALAEAPRLGLCGAALVDEHGRRTSTFGLIVDLPHAVRSTVGRQRRAPLEGNGLQRVDFVPLACALVRRSTYEELGGLDERFRFYFEDHDLCLRLRRKGWEIAVRWDAEAVHVEGGSSRAHEPQRWLHEYHRSRLLLLRKHYPRAWPIYLAAWIPTALAHVVLWLARAGRDVVRGDRRSAAEAAAWAASYARSVLAGVRD